MLGIRDNNLENSWGPLRYVLPDTLLSGLVTCVESQRSVLACTVPEPSSRHPNSGLQFQNLHLDTQTVGLWHKKAEIGTQDFGRICPALLTNGPPEFASQLHEGLQEMV